MSTSAKSQVLFRFKSVEIVSQVVQGTLPNYAQLIPRSYNTRAVVSLQEFSGGGSKIKLYEILGRIALAKIKGGEPRSRIND